jgi:sugar/nucleoside kinase (ribokinase family)
MIFGPKQVVVKRGPKGAACAEAGTEVIFQPTEKVDDTNVVGAGDTFNAALLHCLNRGTTLAEATKTATKLATGAVKRGKGVFGALDSLWEDRPEELPRFRTSARVLAYTTSMSFSR